MNRHLKSFMNNIEGAMMVIQSDINKHVTKDGSIRYVFERQIDLDTHWKLFYYFAEMQGRRILGMIDMQVNEVYIIEVYVREEDK